MLILDSQELCDMFAFDIFQIYPVEQLKPINRGGNILPSNLTIQSAVLGIEVQKTMIHANRIYPTKKILTVMEKI